jgi:hypothetical protein
MRLLLLALLLLPLALRAEPHAPVHAGELLKLLPPAPDGWKLDSSVAKNSFSGWANSQASRKYTGPALPPAAEGAPARGPQKVSLDLMDTGLFPGFLAPFQNFQPAPANGGVERLLIGQRPAIRSVGAQGNEVLQILLANRFILKINLENAAPGAAVDWLRRLNAAPLDALTNAGPTTLTEPLDMYVLDELNPKKSRTYKLQWMTEENIADPSTLPPPPKEVFE